MKLVISAKVPSWWIDHQPNTIETWWNGLEWQSLTPNAERMYFNGCASVDPIQEALCWIDLEAWELAQGLGIEWLYKIAAHTGAKMRWGFETELQNIRELVSGWML